MKKLILTKKSIVTFGVLLLFLFSNLSGKVIPVHAMTKNDQSSLMADKVRASRAIEHTRFLSEKIGPRPSGTKEEHKAATYIGDTLKKLGYEVEYQAFPVPDQYIGSVSLSMYGEKEWQVGAASNASIPKDPVVGKVVSIGKEDDIKNSPEPIHGKIVLLEQADTYEKYNEQVEYAAEKGAKAVLLYSTIGDRGNYGEAFNPVLKKKQSIPVFGLAYNQGIRMKDKIVHNKNIVSLKAKHEMNLSSLNVIAKKKPKYKTDNDDVAIMSAHYDSVIGAPGANDNASGVGLLLELAYNFKDIETNKEIQFIAFGAEENESLGAYHYVNQLSTTDKKHILGVFNADMIATSYKQAKDLYAMTLDGSQNEVTNTAVATSKALGKSVVLTGKFDSSDHVPFNEAGISSALFIWMDVESWNPLIYHVEKVFHTPQDTVLENISPQRMQEALEIIGTSLYYFIKR
ncbi:aminopeptidase [Bacillus cereus]|uniref:M28 family metallopeptidase n=1 Tax=Bacillus cereus TaxID=1396 RepID=UPI000BF90D7D|nr:M28 family metallopeptidase [Bacillus cereus]MCU4981253.1 M28 family peptidase [Bacillus cereus]MEB9611777.1 M28 family peptidase [Bacillus cereus]PET48451.1 aminopeptidase [Bacillus cereus]PEY41013.1 aminopeptidase [Bacillus cereus]PFB47636.1 aminopeptidase [Bacillus cereus]